MLEFTLKLFPISPSINIFIVQAAGVQVKRCDITTIFFQLFSSSYSFVIL